MNTQSKIPPQTQAIIDRIAAMNLENPAIDRERVERAIRAHLLALKLEDRPVRWFKDALDACAALDARAALAALDARAARAARAALDARTARAALYYWSFYGYYSAREAVYWLAATESLQREIPEVAEALGVWLPFAEAYEAGLWLYWILHEEVWVIPRPVMHVKGEQLHCEDGPACHWPEGEEFYFLNGVEVTREIVLTPAASLDPRMILKERNAEVRREIVRKVGIERVCDSLGAKVVDAWGDYELLALPWPDGGTRPYLKMKNPSIGVWHVEGVGVECRTVRDALHWRKPDDMRAIPVSDDGEEWNQQGDVYIWPADAQSLKPLPAVLT